MGLQGVVAGLAEGADLAGKQNSRCDGLRWHKVAVGNTVGGNVGDNSCTGVEERSNKRLDKRGRCRSDDPGRIAGLAEGPGLQVGAGGIDDLAGGCS